MLASWVLFPVLLIGLCLGWGLLLERLVGRCLPGVMLAPAGFVAVIVVAGILTSRGELAPLATPVVVALALLGAGLGVGGRRLAEARVDGWAVAAFVSAFVVYAAPVVLSGHPTFTGYIKLDDTATWMAFADHVVEHGRDLSGLAPSSYSATLQVNLPQGYPVGAFLPLGVGSRLAFTDVAWLVQPYMAVMAGLLALCLYRLAAPLLESRPLRAVVAFGASQSALLFAYGLWGGIKELAVAVALAALAAFAPAAADRQLGWRAALPSALAATALLTMVGSGGLVWIVPILGLAALGLWRAGGIRGLLSRAAPLVLLVALLGIPALFAAGVFSPTQGGLTNEAELGNLLGPLDLSQYAGIWPSGDFRFDPENVALTVYLVALAIVAAITGAVLCWRRRAWEPLLFAIGAGVGSLAVFAYSSPWVGAKALASGSPSFLLLALAGAAAFALRVERAVGTTVLALLLAGVLWSNALGYHDVNLAPYDQLRELETIGEEFSGEGPTLMTEYQPYGVRHFLRKADAEGASELRVRPIPLREGGELEKGDWGDTDQIDLRALLGYRTLILRRNPAQSRPPSVYSLVRSGDYYDVWQRPKAPGTILEHVSLGSFEDPAAVPSCAEVMRLARLAGPEGAVAAAERGPTVGAALTASSYPVGWTPTEPMSSDLVPHGAGGLVLEVSVPRRGRYDLYLQGSVRNRLSVTVDGKEAGAVVEQLNPAKQFLYFGQMPLSRGPHQVVLASAGQTPGPGSGGAPAPIGPLAVSAAENENPPIRRLPSSQARVLCGRSLDWIEALP